MAKYVSNLEAPDLSPFFKLRNPPLLRASHDAPSDPDFLPDCSYFTHDESAILFHVAARINSRVAGHWLDIGARLGWTAAHVAETDCMVVAVDPEQRTALDFRERFFANTRHWVDRIDGLWMTSTEAYEFFRQQKNRRRFKGFTIDGNHDSPEPLRDVTGALEFATDDCVFVLHDFYGGPVRDAGRRLMDNGFHGRVYWTPNGLGVFWRGISGFYPPDHVPDPSIDWNAHRLAMVDFHDHLKRCE